ncbi:MAG: glutaredoxin family protein [Pseudomonadota bacterium]|nr:glutaredoxin family protein [Pseudomonadota bacterium]
MKDLSLMDFVVYSRRSCHLCDDFLAELEPLCRDRAKIIVRNVDSETSWVNAYGDAIPVLVSDGVEVCRYKLDRDAVLRLFQDE